MEEVSKIHSIEGGKFWLGMRVRINDRAARCCGEEGIIVTFKTGHAQYPIGLKLDNKTDAFTIREDWNNDIPYGHAEINSVRELDIIGYASVKLPVHVQREQFEHKIECICDWGKRADDLIEELSENKWVEFSIMRNGPTNKGRIILRFYGRTGGQSKQTFIYDGQCDKLEKFKDALKHLLSKHSCSKMSKEKRQELYNQKRELNGEIEKIEEELKNG